MNDAEYLIQFKADLSDIKAKFNDVGKDASNVGSSAGQAFGNSFKSVLTGILGAISLNSLVSQVKSWYQASNDLKASSLNLSAVIQNQNAQSKETSAILKDTTKSLEEKGLALGYTKDQMYETVAASKTYKSEIAQLNKQIKDAEKAFDAQTQSINDNIDAINKKVAADVRAIQVARGYDILNDSSKTQQAEILDLEIQKQQAVISGDIVATAFLQNQIDLKKDNLKLTQLQIEKINVETDSIKKLADVEIQNLKNQLEDLTKEFKVNINIKEAQDKLESLKAQSAAGGTVTSFNPKVAAEIQNATVPEIDEAAVKAKVEELYNKYQGIVSHGTISSALINIFQAGLKDTDEAGKLVDRFVNAAGQNNNQNIDFATKVTNLSDAYKRANSVLGDASGITENYDRIKEKGIALLNKETGENYKNFDSLTQIQQARVKYLGIMDLTQDRQNGFNIGLENGLLEIAKFEAEQRRLSQTMGKIVTPEFESSLKLLSQLMSEFSAFVKKNPDIIKAFLGVALAVTAISIALSPIFGPLLLVAGIVAAVAYAWNTDFAGMRTEIMKLWEKVEPILTKLGDLFMKHVWPAIVEMVKALQELWDVLAPYVIPVLKFLAEVIFGLLIIGFILIISTIKAVALAITKWANDFKDKMEEAGKVNEKLKKGFEAIGETVKTVFKNIANTIIDSLNFVLKAWKDIAKNFKDVPGLKVVADMVLNIPEIPKFAKGANFIVPQGYENDTFPFMAQSGERVVVIPKDQVNNSEVNNNTEYHNYGLPTSSLSSNFGL